METVQEREWAVAQKIALSVDMVAAAKRHLQFLAAVDRIGHLYEGPPLRRAICRYKACWIPLLAKHTESPLCEEPLAVPLDCEWIWHCHRLSPLKYISDCEKMFGRLLDNRNVVSSIDGSSKKKTEELWSEMYPKEPYELDLQKALSEVALMKSLQGENFTDYDLVSAVGRQSAFYTKVSHMSDDLFLEKSVAKYKAFLHLSKRSIEKYLGLICVPTYDIDLMWHTHQLHPSSYCKDLIELLGKVVDHDDRLTDEPGGKLDLGFERTTHMCKEIYGKMYTDAHANTGTRCAAGCSNCRLATEIANRSGCGLVKKIAGCAGCGIANAV